MSTKRFPPLVVKDLTPEQRSVAESILRGPRFEFTEPLEARGETITLGPFGPMLRNADLAGLVEQVGVCIRFRNSLPASLREMATLLVAGHWKEGFEWWAHRPLAVQAGLDEDVVAALERGERPTSMDDEQRSVYDFVTELLTTGKVSDEAFDAVTSRFGSRGTVDLIGIAGYYTWLAFVLNVDGHPVPDQPRPMPEEGAPPSRVP